MDFVTRLVIVVDCHQIGGDIVSLHCGGGRQEDQSAESCERSHVGIECLIPEG